jgi:iron complex outermembrane recepter protein
MATLPLTVYMGCSLAESTTYNFNIPAQSLSSALNAVSQQTGLQPFYTDGIMAGKQSPALKGNYSKQQTVEKLLADSGLSYTFTGNNSVAVKAKLASGQQAANSARTLAIMTVRDKAGDDANNSYVPVLDADSITKTDIPVFDTPASIQVVSKPLIQDQQATRLEDALQNVSGVCL